MAAPTTLDRMLNLDDVEARARELMPQVVYDFVSGGAADETTVRWNRERFADLKLNQRVLRDLSGLDPSITLFGKKLPMPILLAPTAGHRFTHPEGELATARGAGAVGATMILSTGTHTAIEDVMKVARAPIWFQLYVMKDRAITAALVERVQAAGVEALCVTVDSPLDGARNRQQREILAIPPGVTYPHLAGVREPASIQTLDRVMPANLTWKDIEWLRSITRVPLLLKGIMSGEDALLGIAAGADGIIVSNHGGRCLDTLPATIEVLPEVVAAVKGRVPVMVDGGIRRGTDVVKALALGAAAVSIGRPYVYGLAVGGAVGVEHVLKLLRQELLMAMSLLGCPTIPSVTRDVLWRQVDPMNLARWKIGGQMPLPRAGCAVGAANGGVIVAGGTHWVDGKKFWVDRCDRLDPATGQWESLPPLPRPVGDGATAVAGDRFHLLGGGSDGAGTTDVWCLQDGGWQAALQPLPAPRRSVAAVTHGGDIVVLGGLAGLAADYASATNTVWRSGPGGWRTLAPMPGVARIGFAAGVFGDRLIVAGGFTAEGAGVRNLAEVLAYDFARDAWSQIGQLPQPRRGITGVALPNGGLLAFGGYTDAFSAEVLAIDPTSGAVRVVGMLPKPVADARFVLCAGRLIGVTGEDGMKMRWADWVGSEPVA